MFQIGFIYNLNISHMTWVWLWLSSWHDYGIPLSMVKVMRMTMVWLVRSGKSYLKVWHGYDMGKKILSHTKPWSLWQRCCCCRCCCCCCRCRCRCFLSRICSCCARPPVPKFLQNFTFLKKFYRILQFFGGLVLGCIKTKCCKKICVWQHFSNSTRFAYFCTAAISKF